MTLMHVAAERGRCEKIMGGLVSKGLDIDIRNSNGVRKYEYICIYMYSNLSKICPLGMNLQSSSRRGVGIFLRVVIFLSKVHPPHTQLG